MNIAVLTSLYPGPTRPFEGIFAERRWLGMAARGHEVRVIQPLPYTPGPLARGAWAEIRGMPRAENRGGIEIRRPRYLHLPKRARGNARRFAAIGAHAILAAGKPDVIVCDYAWPAGQIAPIAAEHRIACVLSGRGSDVLEVGGEAGLGAELGSCLVSAGHWCAVSQDLVDAMDRLGQRPGQGVLVPNGVDMERFQPGPRDAAITALGLPPASGARVLVVGHLIPRKDPMLALETFIAGAPEDAQLDFLGRGPLRDEIAARAAALGAADRVHLRGEVPPEQLGSWYQASDVLILTSKREGRPNVVLEALASGCPVLATEAGGTGELLQDWAPRSLCRTRSVADLGPMLRDLLADRPSAAELRASVQHLSWDASLTALESCLAAAQAGRD